MRCDDVRLTGCQECRRQRIAAHERTEPRGVGHIRDAKGAAQRERIDPGLEHEDSVRNLSDNEAQMLASKRDT